MGGGGDNTNAATPPVGSGAGVGTTNASPHGKAVKFAECMRDNGVSAFPDPDASGRLTIDGVVERLVGGPEQCRVEAGHRRVQGPGAAGLHGQQGDAHSRCVRASSSPSACATTA